MTAAGRGRAAVLVLLAAALWWHAWVPGLILVAFVLWAVLHTRYQNGARREAFMRARGRAWPPALVVVLAGIAAGTTLYVASSASLEARIMPIALNTAAFSLLVVTWVRTIVPRAPATVSALESRCSS